MELKESWYEKLNNFEKALQAYDERRREEPDNVEATLGTMRCLNALGDYERVSQLSLDAWNLEGDEQKSARRAMAPVAAYAAWGLGRWREMEKYVESMRQNSVETSFFGAVLHIWKGSHDQAHVCIEKCRDLLDKQVTALVGESYKRAYRMIVSVYGAAHTWMVRAVLYWGCAASPQLQSPQLHSSQSQSQSQSQSGGGGRQR